MAGTLTTHAAIDRLEADMVASGLKIEFPVEHFFTPGLYIRQTTLPKDSMLTSMEHKKRHPFVISKGSVRVISSTEGEVIYSAPYTGITDPGTRRIIHATEETIWTTFHVTNETDIEKIAAEILEPHANPLLSGEGNQWREQLPTKEAACLGSQ